MQVLQMARLLAKGRRGPTRNLGPARTGQQWLDRDTALRKTLLELRTGGVKLDRIPEEAMALLEGAHVEPVHGPARGRRRRR